ncbi:MAG: S41 family peptidase [Defluviitaleaceae bacterium]|nr:S41 family peptidase [Defluviitaleaceae bacterium]
MGLFKLSTAQVQEDIRYLHMVISQNNPFKFLKHRTHGVDWDNMLDGFLARGQKIHARTRTGFLLLIDHMANSTRCGHIYPIPNFIIKQHKNDTSFPADSPWRKIADNPDIYKANISYARIVNFYTNLLQFGRQGKGADSLYDADISPDILYIRLPSMEHPNDKIITWMKAAAEKLKTRKGLIIDMRGNGGGSDHFWRKFLPMFICEDLKTPICCFYRAGEHVRPFAPGIGNTDMENEFNEYISKNNIDLPEELLSCEFAPGVMVTEIISPNPDSVRFGGKIAIIIDGSNFSSAQGFLVRVKHNALATLIGQPTSGDGIGSTPALCVLPNSKLAVYYPVVLGLNPDGTINDEHPIKPDILWDVPKIISADLKNDPAIARAIQEVGE